MWWIEDKVENAVAGKNAGLKPIVIEHGFNMNTDHGFPVAKNWKDIYELITGKGANVIELNKLG